MIDFLTQAQLKALERAIKNAREQAGIHREQTPDGEAYAYQLRDEILWGVNSGTNEGNLAQGSVPLRKP